MNLKDFWKKSQKITSLRETFQQAIKETIRTSLPMRLNSS